MQDACSYVSHTLTQLRGGGTPQNPQIKTPIENVFIFNKGEFSLSGEFRGQKMVLFEIKVKFDR